VKFFLPSVRCQSGRLSLNTPLQSYDPSTTVGNVHIDLVWIEVLNINSYLMSLNVQFTLLLMLNVNLFKFNPLFTSYHWCLAPWSKQDLGVHKRRPRDQHLSDVTHCSTLLGAWRISNLYSFGYHDHVVYMMIPYPLSFMFFETPFTSASDLPRNLFVY
jgi:hypothetical protein